MKSIEITKNEDNQRLDRFLLKFFKNGKRSEIFKWIRKNVKVNGKRVTEEYFLLMGDKLDIYLPDDVFEDKSKIKKEKSTQGKLNIIFENDDILVVDKPAGLLTHPDSKEYKNTLSSYVNHHLQEHISRTFKPASIQRLDKNTSGLVVFAKNYDSLKKYNELMRERKIRKFYYALVHGRIEKAGEVKGYIKKDENENKVYFVKSGGMFVHTTYKPVQNFGDYSLIELEILTGKSHQIRASMAMIGHPLVADMKYGGKRIKGVDMYYLDAYKVVIEGNTITKESKIFELFS
jgi:23S rRNA pseudouridine955/2504/2580 synthase